VAAVEDYEEGAIWWEPGDEVLVQRIAGDLAVALEIDGADCVEDT
jgi:hypothetical protein